MSHTERAFDYCEALYVFTMLWHGGQGSSVHAYTGKLANYGFKPGLSVERGKLNTERSRAFYRALCLRHGV